MKYYAVQKGRIPGIYTSWPECEKQVKGFTGAVYKSFNNEIDAFNFTQSNGYEPSNKSKTKNKINNNDIDLSKYNIDNVESVIVDPSIFASVNVALLESIPPLNVP